MASLHHSSRALVCGARYGRQAKWLKAAPWSAQARYNASIGSYDQLNRMRIPIPWIEALQRQRGKESNPGISKPAKKATSDFSPRKMSDSYTRIVIPLAEDKWLLDKYLNVNGDIRLGAIFMDLDALSGVIAHKHIGENNVMTVTAAIDRINIQNPLHEICNLELSGQVTFATGRSSLEVSLQVAKENNGSWQQKQEDVIMNCAFTMVSLDPETKKPTNVPGLRIDTDQEREVFHQGEINYNAKKLSAKSSLKKTVPNEEESALIHGMWLKQLEYRDLNNSVSKPENIAYMDATRVHSTQIMQPQFRNRHNFMIFGGYLMQQTFELAFTCVAAFSHSRPTFIGLDPSTFENPVPVGSVLYLSAAVAYTEEASQPDDDDSASHEYSRVQVRVDSSVRTVEHGEKKPTGQFNYTFLVRKNVKVMPKTYQEFMIWIDARRRVRHANASSHSRDLKVKNVGGDDGKAGRITE